MTTAADLTFHTPDTHRGQAVRVSFATYAEALEAHETRGGFLTVDNISGGGATAQGLRPDELAGYLVTCEVPDWREDLLHLTDEEWADAEWDETRLATS